MSSKINFHDSQSQMRIAEALERIADTLDRFEFQGAIEEVCQHPESEREPTVSSTMQNVTMRCKACGAEGI